MKSIFIVLLLIVLSFPMVTVAQNQGGGENGGQFGNGREDSLNAGGGSGSVAGDNGSVSAGQGLQNPLNTNSIAGLFQAIIDILMVFAVPLIVFFIVYAGFLYVTARGNTETIQKAHRALLYAIIGGLLIIGANILIDVVQGTVNSING